MFIVDNRANKIQIKDAVRKLYDLKAIKVNTLIRPDGKKKAMVWILSVRHTGRRFSQLLSWSQQRSASGAVRSLHATVPPWKARAFKTSLRVLLPSGSRSPPLCSESLLFAP